MATVPPVRWAFSPLDEELGLRPKVGFTPKVEEGMARLGTWMPFRAAQRELTGAGQRLQEILAQP